MATIHGGMKPGARDEPGTRLHAEQQFREGAVQVLVATEAAGEGINLQVCNILFNYDIPWNPNRLEQRMGRIHPVWPGEDCLIFNFVATNTIEGQVLQRLLDKLQEIRDALDDDAVFNVVGEVLPAAYVERVLRDYYAGRLGGEDLEERLLRDVDEGRLRNICQNALEGLATKNLNLEMLVERCARAREPRVVPETIARFLRDAAPLAPLKLDFIGGLAHTFVPVRTPSSLRRYEREPDWKLPELALRYPRCSTDGPRRWSRTLEFQLWGAPTALAPARLIGPTIHSASQFVLDTHCGCSFPVCSTSKVRRGSQPSDRPPGEGDRRSTEGPREPRLLRHRSSQAPHRHHDRLRRHRQVQ